MRFSSNPYVSERRTEMVEEYARESWTAMVTRWQTIDEETDLSVAQAVLLHCWLDIAGEITPLVPLIPFPVPSHASVILILILLPWC